MQTHRAIALAAVVLAACVDEPPVESPAAAQQAQAIVEAAVKTTAAEAQANNPEAAALAAALAALEVEIGANESRAANTFRAALAAAAEAEANNDVKVIFQATINAFNAAAAAVKATKVEAETYYKTAEATKDSTKAAANAAANAYRTAIQENFVANTDSIAAIKATRDDAKMVIKAMLKLTNDKDAHVAAKDAYVVAQDAFEVAQKVYHTAYTADRDFKRFTSEDPSGYYAGWARAAQNAYNFAKDYTAAH